MLLKSNTKSPVLLNSMKRGKRCIYLLRLTARLPWPFFGGPFPRLLRISNLDSRLSNKRNLRPGLKIFNFFYLILYSNKNITSQPFSCSIFFFLPINNNKLVPKCPQTNKHNQSLLTHIWPIFIRSTSYLTHIFA